MSTRNITTTEMHGRATGAAFDDKVGIPDLNKTAITHIVLRYNTAEYIRAMTVHYNNKVGETRGGTAMSEADVILEPGEFITEVEGSASGGAMSKLGFRTSKGKQWGPYGQPSIASEFTWGGFGDGMGLLYFTGLADEYIRSLSGTFGKYSDPNEPTSVVQPTTVVKYEKHVPTSPDTPSSVGLSKFALNLTSPTVSLVAGADCVRFHAPQSFLCTLPFFAAALHGEFLEASEQSINMPEDEPQYIAALMEYLYTGSYTYVYTPPADVASDAPPVDLAEGCFHVGVYATAFKYDCQPLVKESLTSFIVVLRQLKGIDVIRLWKAAYDQELLLATVDGDPNLVDFRKGLVALLKELYATKREEMKQTSVDHPALINDLLDLVVSG